MRLVKLAGVMAMATGCAGMNADQERSGVVTLKGSPVTLVGPELKVGEEAPLFSGLDATLSKVSLSDFSGRPVLISAVPSLDTGVCAAQTKRFNDELQKLPDEVAVITISMDLPFAQKRFCEQEKIDRAAVISDSALREFGTAYGVLIKDLGLLARSVFVLDGQGRLTYVEIVPEVSSHPDYDAALAALKNACEK